jgi:carboxypeptidase family protein/TonB-dependent receptor-like protein
MPSSFHLLKATVWLVGATALAPANALRAAQAPLPTRANHAVIAGRIIDQASRAPITGARVLLLGTSRDTASDSAGRFAQADLVPGTYLLQVRAIGYSMTTWVLHLSQDQVLEQEFPVSALAFALDPVTVEGKPGLMEERLRGFEARRRNGLGVFITEEQIRRQNANTVSDLLRATSGVRTQCNTSGCAVRMMRSARGLCRPDYFVDGFPSASGTAPSLSTVGIIAIEIYRSPSETPPQFLQPGALCGVIVIWTRSAPT